MNKYKNYLLLTAGIAISLALLVISAIFYSFINMYVWNNVLLHFFELPTITLVGGFGIEIIKNAFIKQIFTVDKDVSASEQIIHDFLFHATTLLSAWIFTLLV